MKNTLRALLLLSVTTAFGQQAAFDRLVEAEMKSAYNIANFTANENTGNYNVTHHTLEFTVDPAVQYITGSVTTTFTALENMGAITFDMSSNLTATSVTQNGNNLSFSSGNNELVITLPTTVAAGAEATITVNYNGAPFDDEDSFVADQHNGIPVLWTLSEPYGAKEWWPCKQDLNDKIDSIDIYVTAPSQYVGVSNGVEQSQQQNEDGTTTTHFHHGFPIPAYLVAIAVTNYQIYNQQAGTAPNDFPIVNYLYPETAAQSQAELAVTPGIMDFFEDTFETYPYHTEKYGHAQCGFGGGMEHTTVSFMGGFYRNLIAHELAHQWFGDKITCGSWQDIWLNEGFATYLSGLVIDHLDGGAVFQQWRQDNVWDITSESWGSVYVPANDTLNVSRVFSSRLTYNKGAMVLHMLRQKLGQDVFYQGVRNYLADENLAFDYAKTPDLQAHLESESGVELDGFFADWVYGQGYPTYHVHAEFPADFQAVVTLTQTQSHPSVSFFEGLVPLRFISTTGLLYDTVVDNTVNGETFTLSVPFEVAEVQVNATYDIISANDTSTLNALDNELLSSIKLYPNPVSDLLNVQLPQGITLLNSEVYNNLGQKVIQGGTQPVWNVSGLAQGTYFLRLKTAQGVVSLKFTKQ
ncbi:peptidase M1 [Flavobacterium akiainvivens]|uniref:Aminopeptidase N n=1 Tax=Flavobacterium akiainvivens TaxID=1202724 RepID=A0A0M9VK23_9FLAO|nr:M1 family aminopeptidase [Flavobacterium akiainvivens]KOS08376.1 peptidase M1 [Flavobacterium akiainvivens]